LIKKGGHDIVVPEKSGEKGKMNYRRKIAAAAACILIACSSFGMSSYGTERPQYLKSVTYFGDEWPINYWNSEDKDMDQNMKKIAADGFNSIILVIPWREFQPAVVGQYFNEGAFERLDKVMECAEENNLGVLLRIGYTWDYLGVSELPERFGGVTVKGSTDWNLWMDYSKRLYETASAHPNFWGGFITWEDFWDYTYNLDRDITMGKRTRMARESGYQAYLSEHYTLEEVAAAYGGKIKSFDEVYIPGGSYPAAELFYEFYDQFLEEFLEATQQVFPGLSMEVRADGDVVYDMDGNKKYYSHSSTYPCPGADYTALMYSVSMGQVNNGNKISAGEALNAMTRNLDSIYATAGKPLFIEQLLYMDSTEAFSHNTQIEDDQVGTFIDNLAPVLSGRTNGYGLWVYRNYVNNVLYNGQFGLGMDGWTFKGNGYVEEHEGTAMAYLGKNGSISQDLTGRIPESSRLYVEFYAEPVMEETTLTVELGDTAKTVRVAGGRTCRIEFANNYQYHLSITADGKAYLDDVRVYTYEQNGRIYCRDGSADAFAENFRRLNSSIDSLSAGGM